MSLKLSMAAVQAYDALKHRPGARPRRSGARDPAVLAEIDRRLRELIGDGRLAWQEGIGEQPYVFWTEVDARLRDGLFDDLLTQL